MTRLGAILAAVLLAILVAASALATTAEAQTAMRVARSVRASQFDGLWSVSIYTRTGPCAPSYRYPARIFGGRVVQAEPSSDYQIAGAVAASGAIAVSVSARGQNATGYGRLTRTRGAGWWRTQYGDCTGIWEAIRR